MLKKILNEVTLTFHIKATGPILVKEGDTEENSSLMRFVVDANQKIFIPGSSIRGVWRSWCEKIARTISNGVSLACDPFQNDTSDTVNLSCSKRLEKMDSSDVYALSCPICKLFGNTSQGSRIRISDAYIVDGDVPRDNLPIRDGIGIDRFTGGASSGAKFRYQYLVGKTFETEVSIRNFEIWQLGLLAYLFRDFEEELVPIGFGKTRGLGKVKGTIEGATFIFYGINQPKVDNTGKRVEIAGIGSFYSDVDREGYCFANEAVLETGFEEVKKTPVKRKLTLNAEQASNFFTRAGDFWATLQDDDTPGGYFLVAQNMRNEWLSEGIDE